MGKIGVLNLCLSLFLLNLQSLARGDSHVVTEFNATEDSKLYRGLVLQNDLEVVLISDSNKHHKAAASLIVSDGFMEDPPQLEGLSHLLEHLLIIQSVKYPEINSLYKFILENDGTMQATTYCDRVEYHFNVTAAKLFPALDIFSQLFIAPLFTESGIEKEVRVVNIEAQHYSEANSFDRLKISKILYADGHPVTRFSGGDLTTLWTNPKLHGINLTSELKNHFKTYYSANLMKLVVSGSQDLDILQNKVAEMFGQIANHNVTRPSYPDPIKPENGSIYKAEILPNFLRKVEDDMLLMDFSFYTDDYINVSLLRQGYLKPLLEYDREGSLINILQNEGLIIDLKMESVNIPSFSKFAELYISIRLTRDGLLNYEDVICRIFQFFNNLEIFGLQDWYWKDSIKNVKTKLSQGVADQVQLVSSISGWIHHLPIQKAINSWYHTNFDPYNNNTWNLILAKLTPKHLRIKVSGIAVVQNKTILVDRVSGVEYYVDTVHSDIANKWMKCRFCNESHNFTLPVQPTVEVDEEFPLFKERQLNSSLSTISFIRYSYCDSSWAKLEIYSPFSYIDPRSAALNSILFHSLKRVLNRVLISDPEITLNSMVQNKNWIGMEFMWHCTKIGRLMSLIGDVLQAANNLTLFTPREFQLSKAIYLAELNAKLESAPCRQVDVHELLQSKVWLTQDILPFVGELTLSDMELYTKKFFFPHPFYVDFMPLVVDFEKPFLISGSKELLSKEIVKQRFVDIPAGSAWLYSQNGVNFHKTSCAKVYLFHISKNDWDNDLIQLTKLMMKAEALNRLRTNETLGYRVFTETYFLNKRTSCVSIAVDSLKDPYFVAERIHSFLRDFAESLKNMTEEHLSTTISTHQSLNYLKNETGANEFIQFYEELIGLREGQTRRLTIITPSVEYATKEYSKADELSLNSTYIKNFDDWKKTLKLQEEKFT